MPRPGHRRQVSLFLVTVLLPCLALVVLGIQLMRHESDLFQNRLQEEKQRLAVVVRTALSDQLDRISEGHDQALVFAVAVEDGKLVPPWEDYPGLLPRDTAFQRRIDDAQAEERIDPLAAMDAYRELVQSVEDPFQRYYSELQLARVQEAVGEGDSATASLRAVLEAPDSAVDEFGIHVALYAARLSSRKPGEALLDRVVRLVQRNEWLTPMALSRCRDLSQTLVETASGAEAMRKAADLQRTTLSRIGRQNRFLELSEAFPGLLGQLEEPRGWAPFGEPLLLVGLRGRGREQRLLAIDANELLRSPDFSSGLPDSLRDGIRLTEDWSQGGEVLGPPFSSVRLIFVDSRLMGPFVESMRSRRWFYGVILLLVVGIILFGGHLLWQDMRRERDLAALRTQFVSSLTHELKTPLTSIRMLIETILNEDPGQAKRTEYLGVILGESERLSRLLGNVLHYSQIQRGIKRYSLAVDSLQDVVRTAARAVAYPFSQQGFHLRVDIGESVPPACIDRDAIQQAILNLLSNAMSYSGDSHEVDLSLRQEGAIAIISVEDRGIGIAAEEHERIFAEFYRVPRPGQPRVEGTGLGLTLVSHIARAHGGQVNVESRPGKGSRFDLRIPLGTGS